MDQRRRKLMTMHKALHPRDDVDRLYVSRKEGGRGLASIEDNVDASIQRFEDYIEKYEGGLITAIRNDSENTNDNNCYIIAEGFRFMPLSLVRLGTFRLGAWVG